MRMMEAMETGKEVTLSSRQEMVFEVGEWLRRFLPGGALRIGEAAVVSTHPHRLNAHRPDEVRIRMDADAGEVYLAYGQKGRILHLDVFHAPAEVPLEAVAAACRVATEEYCHLMGLLAEDADCRAQFLVQKMYVRTAVGEGTVASFPQKTAWLPRKMPSQNHVHLLLEMLPEDYPLLFFLVDHLEEALTLLRIELRRVERLVPSYGKRTGFREGLVVPFPLGCRLRDAQFPPGYHAHLRLQSVMELSQAFGGPDNLLDFLSAFQPGQKKRLKNLQKRFGNSGDLMEELVKRGILRQQWLGYALTEKGEQLRSFILSFQRELEAQWRRFLRRVPVTGEVGEEIRHTRPQARIKPRSLGEKVAPLDEKEWTREVAVPETILEAARARLARREPYLCVHREDLRVIRPRQTMPMDICLLVDASASMAGRRIRSACYLGEHLLLTTRARVAIILLQDRGAKVVVPFTRSYQRMRQGLRTIETGGLTPLAEGILGSLQLIRRARAKNPFLILITDGLPTVPKWTGDPLEDALKAGEEIAKAGVHFLCIGLQPDKDFLNELTRRAGGTLYVFDDLKAENMIRVVRQEQRRLLV